MISNTGSNQEYSSIYHKGMEVLLIYFSRYFIILDSTAYEIQGKFFKMAGFLIDYFFTQSKIFQKHLQHYYNKELISPKHLSKCFQGSKLTLAQGKLKLPQASYFSALTCPMGKLTKYSILNNIMQDYLEIQFRSSFVAIK